MAHHYSNVSINITKRMKHAKENWLIKQCDIINYGLSTDNRKTSLIHHDN